MSAIRDGLSSGGPESPLEEQFLHTADKYLSRKVFLTTQEAVVTPYGSFRLDAALRQDLGPNPPGFMGRISGPPYGIEVDGKDYHDEDDDLWRDAAILLSSDVRAIFRIRGRYLFRYPAEVWYLLAKLAPWILDDRARHVLEGQVNAGCRNPESCWITPDSVAAQLEFQREGSGDLDTEEDGRPSWWDVISVERRTLASETVRECCAWLNKYPTLRLQAIRQLASASQ